MKLEELQDIFSDLDNFTIYQYQKCPNTIETALNIFRKQKSNIAILALEQEIGRGRTGKHWDSPHGNYYNSILLNKEVLQENLTFLNFIFALAIADYISDILKNDIEVKIKWPNDIYLENKKIAGILVQNYINKCSIISFGINIAGQSKVENATYLQKYANNIPDIKESFSNIIQSISKYIFKRKADVYSLINEHSLYQKGDKIKVTGQVGNFLYEAISKEGELIVLDDRGDKFLISSAHIIE